MARLIRAAFFIVLIFTARTAMATTHYISTSLGSDSNAGTSEKVPWAHLPGMPDCTANCASYTPVAGDQFIFRGGDTWGNADLGINWRGAWKGTSGSPIYIGVDPTWYSGSSWSRPILNCGGSPCANTDLGEQMITVQSGASYVTFDNFEEKGWEQKGGSAAVNQTLADHTTFENFYVHGWSRDSGETSNGSTAAFTANVSNGAAAVAGSSFHGNVIDGSDTTKDMMLGFNSGENIYDNVCNYLVVCAHATITNLYGNLSMNVVYSYACLDGYSTCDHCDAFFMFGAMSGTVQKMYNNVAAGPTVGGCVMLWDGTTLGGSCPTCVGYIFNNVDGNVSNASSGGVTVGIHISYGNTGTYYVYNNTLIGISGACIANSDSSEPARSTTYFGNNHCIGASVVCSGAGTTCEDKGANLSQTEAQAKSAGYTPTEQYAYSPASGSAPTVGAGNNYESLCGTIPDICYDTSYPTYDQTNHTVVLRPVNSRPESGPWDIGAYQFTSSQSQNPQAPTNLKAAVD